MKSISLPKKAIHQLKGPKEEDNQNLRSNGSESPLKPVEWCQGEWDIWIGTCIKKWMNMWPTTHIGFYILDLGFPLLLRSHTNHVRESTTIFSIIIHFKHSNIKHFSAWACECGITEMANVWSKEVAILQKSVSLFLHSVSRVNASIFAVEWNSSF